MNSVLEQAILDLDIKDIENVAGINVIFNGKHIITNGKAKVFPTKKWVKTHRKNIIKLIEGLEGK